jgi:hypothetical protein
MSKKIELFLGLPNFGGLLHAPFVRSLLRCQQSAKPCFSQLSFIDGDSLVSRARNTIVEMFLNGPCTHLVFIDTDIEFLEEDVDKLVKHLKDGHTIVSGLYPKKQDKLEWVVNAKTDDFAISPENPLVEINYAGTGFLAIAREVFYDIRAKAGRNFWFWTDNGQGGRRQQHDYFPVGVYEYADGNRRYLSEDWYFCALAKDSGHKIMCDTSIKTKHIGKKVFGEDTCHG